jgi:hypothetical protein
MLNWVIQHVPECALRQGGSGFEVIDREKTSKDINQKTHINRVAEVTTDKRPSDSLSPVTCITYHQPLDFLAAFPVISLRH